MTTMETGLDTKESIKKLPRHSASRWVHNEREI